MNGQTYFGSNFLLWATFEVFAVFLNVVDPVKSITIYKITSKYRANLNHIIKNCNIRFEARQQSNGQSTQVQAKSSPSQCGQNNVSTRDTILCPFVHSNTAHFETSPDKTLQDFQYMSDKNTRQRPCLVTFAVHNSVQIHQGEKDPFFYSFKFKHDISTSCRHMYQLSSFDAGCVSPLCLLFSSLLMYRRGYSSQRMVWINCRAVQCVVIL